MKKKLVFWGTNSSDEKVLIGMELRPEDNKVMVFTFPETVVTEEFNQQMMKDWRDGAEVEFPERHEATEKELVMSEGLLPNGFKVERDDLIQRAQTEWHFIVLSSRLYESYVSELNQLAEKINEASKFENQRWDGLKHFWDKVQGQVNERNLFREHADMLREKTNELFGALKELRSKLDDEFKRLSKDNQDKFFASLAEVEQKFKDGMRLQSIFDELKELQKNFRNTKFTRDHRTKVWDKLDALFKEVKEKRFGATGDNRSALERIERRNAGLLAAIDKMQKSIDRDKEELSFQEKKAASSDGQLESQIRQAKIKMIEERIHSKEEKLSEMFQTKADLDRRLDAQLVKEKQREEQEAIEEAKKEAQQKIAEEIKEKANARAEVEEKLEKAAEAILNKPASEEE
ncbi:MAG: hypothetical protein NWR67_14860 [Saprospiraceae bacterium]|nr:hypothetical protein [Saprospiraceae bacterium]